LTVNNKKIDAWKIYESSNDIRFLYKGICFNSPDKQIYSYFQGFAWNTVNNLDMNVLTMFLDHIKTIICRNDETIYNYMINWFAFIAQNPGKKNKTAFIIISEFGS
jgi:hypothetical protein